MLADGVLRVEVHDSGPGEIRVPDPTPESERGRGLLLVAALADDWGVRERDPGKIVWCDFAVRASLDRRQHESSASFSNSPRLIARSSAQTWPGSSAARSAAVKVTMPL